MGHSTRDVATSTLLPGFPTLENVPDQGTFEIWHKLERDIKNSRTQLLEEISLEIQEKMEIIARTLLDSSYDFMVALIMNADADSSILLCQRFSEKNILSLLADQMRHMFYDLYQDRILGRNKLGSSTVENTAVIMWDTLHSHEVMADFSKHKINTTLTSNLYLSASSSRPRFMDNFKIFTR